MSMAMLTDAIRSEANRFGRNRMMVFWSLCFVPIIVLITSVGMMIFSKVKTVELTASNPAIAAMPSQPVDLGANLVGAADSLANPLILAFLLIGAATIYAGDYRWETWRLISARNSRVNLVLGKVVLVVLAGLVAMAGWFMVSFVNDLIQAALFSRSLTASMTGEQAGQLLGLTGLSWVRLIQFTMLSLLTATLTRSLLAALFVPLVVTVGQIFLTSALGRFGLEPQDWAAQLMIPGLAYDMLKALAQGAPGAPDGIVLKASISLALWTFGPLAAALAWFQRQDLSKE